MNIWLFLLIPIIGAGIMLKWFPDRLKWFEVLIPFGACLLFILIFKFTVEKINTSDTEYHGALITEARHYDYWESYVHRTCYRSVKSGKSTIQVPYDCSYTETHPEYWEIVNSYGETFTISREYYNSLIKKWKANEVFKELNRSINHHFGRGKDGDMHFIKWNNQPLTAESSSTKHSYTNRLQAAHTAFDYPDISESEVKQYQLFDYPDINNFRQETVLGLEHTKWISGQEVDKMKQLAKYLNGYMGTKKHGRVYILFYVDKPSIVGNLQEAYWSGGNDNELVVCIGLSSKNRDIQWAKVFSWSDNKQMVSKIKRDIIMNKTFNVDNLYNTIFNNIQNYKRKDFEEFSYINVDPPTWAKWVTFIITLGLTFGLCYWAVTNDLEN